MNSRMHSLLLAVAIAASITVSTPSLADRYGLDEQREEEDAAKCGSDPQCMAAVRRYKAKQTEQERQRELRDQALKESDPPAYYMTVFGRILLAVLLVAGVIGAYTFLFSLGGKKK